MLIPSVKKTPAIARHCALVNTILHQYALPAGERTAVGGRHGQVRTAVKIDELT